jgi:Domain of unknown function (DUF4178)
MKIQVKDIISFAGRDYVVEGTASYHLAGKTSLLARAVDGDVVFWIESPRDDAGEAVGDRLLVLREIRDLEIAVPPPQSIAYHDLTYVQRLAGRATVDLAGEVPERSAGAVDVWRYRAAGDLYLQIEAGGGRVFMLAGESVHRGMIDVLPGR